MRVITLLLLLASIAGACATQPEPVVKEGLPGGGNGFCCHHGSSTGPYWVVGETSPGGVLLTSANIASLCASGALPVRVGCIAGH